MKVSMRVLLSAIASIAAFSSVGAAARAATIEVPTAGFTITNTDRASPGATPFALPPTAQVPVGGALYDFRIPLALHGLPTAIDGKPPVMNVLCEMFTELHTPNVGAANLDFVSDVNGNYVGTMQLPIQLQGSQLPTVYQCSLTAYVGGSSPVVPIDSKEMFGVVPGVLQGPLQSQSLLVIPTSSLSAHGSALIASGNLAVSGPGAQSSPGPGSVAGAPSFVFKVPVVLKSIPASSNGASVVTIVQCEVADSSGSSMGFGWHQIDLGGSRSWTGTLPVNVQLSNSYGKDPSSYTCSLRAYANLPIAGIDITSSILEPGMLSTSGSV